MAQPQLKPTYDDQEPEPQSAYDRARNRWGMTPDPEQSDDDQNAEASNDQQNTSARDRANQAWGMGGGSVAEGESNADPLAGNNLGGALNDSENAMSSAAKIPKINTDNLTPAAKGIKKFIIKGLTRKNATRAGVGMGGLGFLVAIYMAGASLYLVHLKELITGDNNKISSAVSLNLRSRRVNSLMRMLRAGSSKIRTEAFVLKAEAAGINVVKDSDGKILKLVGEGGQELIVNKGSKDMLKDIRALYTGDDAGRAFATKIDDISREIGSRFAGPVVRKKVFEEILGFKIRVNFIDAWIKDRAARKGVAEVTEEVANAPPKNVLAHAAAQAGAVEDKIVSSLNANDVSRVLPEGQPVTGVVDVSDIAGELSDEVENFEKNVGVDISQPLTKNAGEVIKDGVANSADEIATTFGAGEKVSEGALRRLATKLGPRVSGKIASTLAKLGVDVTTLWREGCRTKGTLDFVKNVRNVFLAIELAKFTYKLYTVADHQQAGLASSTSVNLMSIFMEGATGSSGFQAMLGNGSVSGGSLSAYGTAFGAIGIFAALSSWLNKLPGLGPDSCSIATNPLTQFGGSLVGGGLIAFTGGSGNALLTGSSITFALGLTIINEIAFGILTPMMISSVTGALLSGGENFEDAGSMSVAGNEVIETMANGANGAMAIQESELKLSMNKAEIFREDRIKSKSFASRYFDIGDSDSLVARASMYAPLSLPGLSNILRSDILVPNLNVASLFNFGGTADALGEDCNDVTADKYGAALGNFCSPILGYAPLLDLDQTEAILIETGNITLTGGISPGSELDKFAQNCFSGRTGMLHPKEFSQDGTTDPIDPTCIPWATEGDFLGNLPGDVAEDVDGNEIVRVPSKKERFAAWYGYLADEENMVADINDELSGGPSKVTDAQNNKIFFLGDSLTVGMQNLAGTDSTGNYLEKTFNDAGWQAQVDAQGCRAVYQTQGPIQGDGSSCPAQIIVDGITAVTNGASYLGEDKMGTVVIGLGTNKYELGPDGNADTQVFIDKAQELIDKIKTLSPSAGIYWVNLTTEPNNQSTTDRNEALKQLIDGLPETSKVKLLDWNDFVKTANATPSTTDDVGFADSDSVHHTADGYKKKVQYLLDNIPLPTPAGIGPIITDRDTTDINCADGLGEGSIVTGHENGPENERQIKVCDVGGGKIRRVNSQLSGTVDKMVKDAASSGINLSGGAFRSIDEQISLWRIRCGPDYPITEPWDSQICSGAQLARPGRSMHQLGLAIDISCDGLLIQSTDSPCFLWLEKNAVNYGLYEWGNTEKLAVSPERNIGEYEAWHWSINGN